MMIMMNKKNSMMTWSKGREDEGDEKKGDDENDDAEASAFKDSEASEKEHNGHVE